MNAQSLITALQARGFTLTPTEGGIIVKPSKSLTDVDRAAIRSHKNALLNLLAAPAAHHWKADCAELFAAARAQVERNLSSGNCPDCGGGLVENKLGEETLRYCQACDFTYSAADFAEIRAHLNWRRNRQAMKEAA